MGVSALGIDVHNRSLLQIGDWHIVKTMFPEQGEYCFAVHTDCEPMDWNMNVRVRDNICYRCGDRVPDELQALITLYHWET